MSVTPSHRDTAPPNGRQRSRAIQKPSFVAEDRPPLPTLTLSTLIVYQLSLCVSNLAGNIRAYGRNPMTLNTVTAPRDAGPDEVRVGCLSRRVSQSLMAASSPPPAGCW